MKTNLVQASRLFIFCGLLSSFFLQPLSAFAADGSGTNTVSPTTATASSTGNTYTFTFTAAEAMDSGSITLTIPSGWSAPQGTSGVAGYTTVSSTGTTGTVLDAANSLTGWSTGNACSGSFTLETTTKHEGTGAVKCVNSNDKVHDVFYKTISAQNWSSYTTIGFWIYSDVGVNNGDLKFDYDDTAALASPIESLSLGRNVPANTWTYVPFPFVLAGSTRTSIVSFGLEIANASNMKNATVIVDNFMAGPASGPTFSGQTITIHALTLAVGETVTVTYGAGGGTSGATAPATTGVYTFTTQTRTSDSGTLTNISSSPTVTINNPVPTTTSIAPTTKTVGQAQFTMTVNGTNFSSSSTVQLDGSNRTTTYVSATQLTATIPATDMSSATTHSITVVNGTPGGGTSNAQTFTVVAAPTVTNVTSSTSDGSYTTGQVIPVQVTFSRAVTVTGTPQLTLSTGSPSTMAVSYSSGSGGTTLTFNYTVASGNTSTDLDYASTSALALNSGTITDTTTDANATLTLASPGAATSLGANKALVIDTTAPTVSGVTSSTANGSYTTGQVIPVQVNFSEAVTVTGTPRLTLSTGSPSTTALDYTSGSGTSTLTFNYTVASGNFSSKLDYAATTSLSLNSGTIRDAAANNATLTLASPGAANSLGANKAIVIDTIAPTLAEVTPVTTPTNDTTPNYTFSSNESGTITYGGDCSSADTTASAGNNTVTFTALSEAVHSNCTVTVTDTAGNASSALAVSAFTIDTTSPTVSGVTSATANGSYKAGQAISIQVNFSEAVTVTGTPRLTLSTGSPATTAVNYVSGSGTTSLTFTYTIASGNVSADLDYAATTSLALNSGTIKDAAGNNATLTLASPGAANSLGANKAIIIDTTAPTLAEVTPVMTPTNDATPNYTFSTTEAGMITYGGDCSSATASATSGNNTVTFDALADGSHTNCTVTVTDVAGNASSALSVSDFTIDTISPTVSGVTSATANGSYKAGQAISIQVNFTEAIIVTGTPQLTLSTGSPATTAVNYVSGSGTTSLTFTYTIAAGNTSADLDYAATTSLGLNSGTMKDAAGNNATRTLVTPGAANSLGANKNIVIDTTAPMLAEVTPVMTPTNDTTPNYTFSSSEAGTITYGGDCSSATASATSGNNTVTFNTLSAAAHSNCTVTVTDAAGNASSALNVSAFTIDTTAPTLVQVTAVTTPTSDTTPNYTFSSSEAGTIAYGGDCSATTSSAAVGNNTITFSTLSSGAHSNCTITVMDAAGNISSMLAITSFTIDATAPVVVQVTAVTTPTNDTTPNYTFSSSEAGTITYGGDCSAVTSSATVGNNTITFNVLAQGTHSNCTITVTDASGNVSAALAVTSFVIDTTAPILTEVTPITTPTPDVTPSYTFSTTEAGTITYGGDCTATQTTATVGNNTVTFGALAEGLHSNCTITVTDAVGNVSAVLTITAFTVQLPPPAVKFVIIDPSDTTVGSNVTFTVQAQSSSGAVVVSYQNDITLTFSGSATIVGGNALVDIDDGVGTITITNTVAESITASLVDTEGTGLNIDSTQAVVFAPGALHHFAIDTIGTQTVGQPITVAMTAQDQYGNTVTSFTGTVDFSTNAGTIAPTMSSAFVGGLGSKSVTVTQSGSGKTISVVRTGGGPNGVSNGFTVNAGSTAAYFLSDPGSMTAGTRIAYTVTRKDAQSNLATAGSDIVRLYTSSGATAQFYDAAIGGNAVTSATVQSGQSQATFWYADDNVGTWTVTASDAVGAPDGSIGIADATDSIDVTDGPIIATKFAFQVASSATVGDTVAVTVKAVNNAGQLDTTYNRINNSIFLHSTGSATANSGVAFTIVNGIGAINMTDTVAETVTLSLQDLIPNVPPLDASATAQVVFNAGALHHFVVDTPTAQIAGVPFILVVSAKDQYGNTVPGFNGTANLSTTAGTISPAASGVFVSGVLNESVTVTQSGTGKTIAAVRTGGTEAGISGHFIVSPGPTAAYELTNPGSMTAGTRIAYTVTRKDANGNAVISGAENVRLYTTSASPAAFFGAASGGSTISQITLADGQSQAQFWYFDSHEGTWIVTVSDNGSAADGTVGIDDATDSVTVDAAPILATKFLVYAQTSASVGSNVIITVKAVDNASDVDTTYTHDVTLTVSSSATIVGGNPLVDIVSGVGSVTITDAVAETITVGLNDTQATGLDISHTRPIVFESSGGTSVQPQNVNVFVDESSPVNAINVSFSGKAFPKGIANAFVIENGNIPIKQDTTSADGRFSLAFSTMLDGDRFYGVFVTDQKGRNSQAKIFSSKEAEEILSVKDILFSPTIDIERDSISKGDFVVVTGSATPGSIIELEIDNKLVSVKAVTNANGIYRMLYNTGLYGYGTHSARVRQTTIKREISDFSVLKTFALVDYRIQPGDINRDGDVDVRDGSIFLALWSATDAVARKRIDLNGDGTVGVKDFSIFIRTIQGKQ